MDKILLASNNQHKIKEFNEILHGRFDLVSQSQLNIEEIEETGLSFVENAILVLLIVAFYANDLALAQVLFGALERKLLGRENLLYV